MKPNHENGGEFKEIATNVPGIRISEHLPTLAKHADKMALVRSLSTKEGDHGRGTHLMTTGKPPMGTIDYPAIGAALAKDTRQRSRRIAHLHKYRALPRTGKTLLLGPGFLGPRHSPLIVNGIRLT